MTRAATRSTTPSLHVLLLAILLALGSLLGLPLRAAADGPTTFDNTTSIAIPAAGSANQIGPASPYPSNISVSGMTGAVTKVTVTFHNLTHSILNDIDAMVVAPSGDNLVVLSDASDTNTFTFATNATLTFDDSGSAIPGSGNVPTGTYRPTNRNDGKVDSFPAPAPTPSSDTTLAGAFTGISGAGLNGTWSLYAVDDTTGDLGTMAGGWSLTITTETAAAATTTEVSSSDLFSNTGDSVTFSATVRAGATPMTTGTVQFDADGVNFGGTRPLNASGVATVSLATLTEGTHLIRATYSGATGFLTSDGTVSQRVDNATVVTDNTFCNTGPITPPDRGIATPYPSNIFVTGLPGQVTKVTANLKGVTHTESQDLDILLSGPTPATNVVLLSDVGGNTNGVSNANLVFDDAAASTVPSPIVSGTFRPTNNSPTGSPADSWPAPAPSPSSATTLATFNGASGNGTWSLWVVDDATGDTGSISGGWCVTITSQSPTTTALTASPNPSTFGQQVTLTATVTSGGNPVTTGTVQFRDGGTNLGAPVTVNSSGVATVNTSDLAVGSHAITAVYGGTATLATSTGSVTQVVNRAPTTTTLTSSLNPSHVGDTVTFTASVTTGSNPLTTGSVQFAVDGTNTGGAVALNASGQATLINGALPAGTHTITATYGQTTNYATSHGDLSQAVDKFVTQTALTSSLNPSTFGDSVTFTATVTSSGSPVASGSVEFVDGATVLDTVPVVADGTATFTTSTLVGGSHTVHARFATTPVYAASESQLTQVVGVLASTTVLTSSLTPSTFGQSVTFTARVAAGGAPVTAGSVVFADGTTALGTVPVAADGTATFTTSTLTVGSHTIHAAYAGTTSYGASEDELTQTVDQRASTTTVTSNNNPSTYGQSVTFTATVTAGGAPATGGTVQFSEGGTVVGTAVPVAADGTARLTIASLSGGTHTITATYSGTVDTIGSSGSVDQVVAAATTQIDGSIGPASSTYGDTFRLAAAVSVRADPVTVGSVQFSVDGSPLGTPVPLASDGTAVLEWDTFAAGPHTITLAYLGTANFAPTSLDSLLTVNPQPTTTVAVSSANSSALGDLVTFQATVTGNLGDPVSGGTVTFSEGATTLATVPLAPAGTAAFSTSSLTPGAHTITATYSGAANFAGSSGTVAQQIVAPTTTVVTSAVNPSLSNQTITFTVTITSVNGPVTEGRLRFTGPLGTSEEPVSPTGVKTIIIEGLLPAGSYPITATYLGSATYAGSEDSSVVQVINPIPTTGQLAASVSPSTARDDVTFTMTLTSAIAVFGGTVQFAVDGSPLGNPVPLTFAGTASLTTDELTAGSHTVTATYSGTDYFAGTSATLNHTVNQIATSVGLTADSATTSYGTPLVFTATVTDANGPVGDGQVTFSVDGTVAQAGIDVAADGTATFTTSTLSAGTHTILAEYSGTDTLAPSSSAPMNHEVTIVASAGGPYAIHEGDDVTLDASGSSRTGDYQWDLNNDGVFGDATGLDPTLTWADLEFFGIDDGLSTPTSYPIAVRITSHGVTKDATSTIVVTNTAPDSVLTGDLSATVGKPFTIKVGADDPSSGDMAAQFKYTVDWGDGSPVSTVDGPADPPVTHTYSSAGDFAASFTATDKDGGTGPGTEVVVVSQVDDDDSDGNSDDSDSDSTSDTDLASTGSSVGLGAFLLSLALLASGGGLLLEARRRRRTGEPRHR